MREKTQLDTPRARVAGGMSTSLKTDDAGYLRLVGANVRAARARRGMTRKMLASHSGVSERFLAQLETGTGNASILVLRQIASALDVPAVSLLGDYQADPADLAHTMEFLKRLDSGRLQKARELLLQEFGEVNANARSKRVALIGLRGAGKSSLGKIVAEDLAVPFFELDRLVEEASGVPMNMIFDLYGQSSFRRFERRCLEKLLEKHSTFVLATGGGLVSEPATYDRLLTACYTVWLRATPEEHMSRVVNQGDMRPMAHNREAMSDLKRILAEREHLYGKADATIDTSGRAISDVEQELLKLVSNQES